MERQQKDKKSPTTLPRAHNSNCIEGIVYALLPSLILWAAIISGGCFLCNWIIKHYGG